MENQEPRYTKQHLMILKCIKQYLKDKGKFHWGDSATWKRAKAMDDKVSFGSYCQEVEHYVDEFENVSFLGISPFNIFGKENKPFDNATFIKFMTGESVSWTTAQMIAYHAVYKTNEDHKGQESGWSDKPDDVRIVNQWYYNKKLCVKTVYGNMFETDAKSRLPWSFKGTIDDENKTIKVIQG
tara:strand:- start:508 stop:1056 length:549 start_codon:yes stop_codon:yes gene_type:complete